MRQTLECEAMRWAGGFFQPGEIVSNGEDLLRSWNIYVREGVVDYIPSARLDLEAAARSSNLLTP